MHFEDKLDLISPSVMPIWLGMLGGGQLGRMFVEAARRMGYRVVVLDPDEHSPAGDIADRHICADYSDESALLEMAKQASAVTTEFENVPAHTLAFLAQHVRVRPNAHAVSIAQDRSREKHFLQQTGEQSTPRFSPAPYADIASLDDCQQADIDNLLPGILKVSRCGYDGKGQIRVQTRADLIAAFNQLGQQACVLEKMLNFVKEVSVIAVRGADGQTVAYPCGENIHTQGILDINIVPARVASGVSERAQHIATTIATALDYVGVVGVEFFVMPDESLIVNEIAPRPHNSGHYTIDACAHSQFDQQVRALVGATLANPRLLSPAVMVNLLGDAWPEVELCWHEIINAGDVFANTHLHLYGKREARVGRKMGHFTCLANDAGEPVADVLERARLIVSKLR
jgi:5-(carboxyamino)imidazole ribonucleotide synthase